MGAYVIIYYTDAKESDDIGYMCVVSTTHKKFRWQRGLNLKKYTFTDP